MTYVKPEVTELGDATQVIQDPTSSKLIHVVADGLQPKRQTTAYDLDE
jgi:hypothetical protein